MYSCLRVLDIVCRVGRYRRGELSVHYGDPSFTSLFVEDTSHVGLLVSGPFWGESVAVQDHVLVARSSSRNEGELRSSCHGTRGDNLTRSDDSIYTSCACYSNPCISTLVIDDVIPPFACPLASSISC